MSDFKFNEQYDFLQQNYGGKSRNGPKTVNKIIKAAALQESKGEELISVHFPKQMIRGNQQDLFIQLIRFKYLSIMQPQCCFNEDNEYVLVYQDYLKYQLTNEKYHELVQQGKGLRILLQLALGMFIIKLAFDEFEKRHYLWPLKTIEDLYYIDGLIFLSLADYDFNPQYQFSSNYQIFSNFVRQYFCCYFKEIEELLFRNSFEIIIKYLLEKEGNMHIINHLNPPYENVLIYLLQIKNFQILYQAGNSVVKSFNTPNIYKQLFGKLKESIVYKSTKFQSEEFKQQILTNMNREIELMEKFNDQSYMAVCFTYFRIGDYSFLLQKKFVGTLADALKTWQPSSTQQQQKDVYTFSQRFANALKEMHKFNIIHRDLKPENLFFDSLELTTSWVYIADFDRSKQLKENQTTNSVLTTLNNACTPKYDPPEENQTLQYDVFQYGLIVLTVANRGKYIGHDLGGPRMMSYEQYESYYGSVAIRSTLAKYEYKEEFLQIIISCLNRDPQYRPNANVIYDVMNKLSYKAKISIVTQGSSSSQSPTKISSNAHTPNSMTPLTPSCFDVKETNQGPVINNFQQTTAPPPQFVPNFNSQPNNQTPYMNYQIPNNFFPPQQFQQAPPKRNSLMEQETPQPNQPIYRMNSYTGVQEGSCVYNKIKIISVNQNGQQIQQPQQPQQPQYQDQQQLQGRWNTPQ